MKYITLSCSKLNRKVHFVPEKCREIKVTYVTRGLYDYKLKMFEVASLFFQISTQHERKSLEFHTYQIHMHIVE